MGREKGMSQPEKGERSVPSWARMAPSLAPTLLPLQRKPEGLAQSPEAPGKECSQLPSANSKAGWLSGSADLLETATHFLEPTMEPRLAHCADDQLNSSPGCASRADLAEEERQFAKYHGTPVTGASPPHRPQACYIPSWLSLSREAAGSGLNTVTLRQMT